jgi:hypothetical protein
MLLVKFIWHTCTMGMIVEVNVQILLRKGICVAPATSWSTFPVAKVYSRILSTVAKVLGGIANVCVLLRFWETGVYISQDAVR